MTHLDDITVEELRQALAEVEGKTPTKRLLAAIAYKNGITQTELAAWYGVQRRTIYSWLTRLESGSLTEAVVDAERSGRPRKLTSDQQREFESALRDSPPEVGIDAPSWTPLLVRRYLRETFDVEYSRPSCRRLMKEAGLRYRKPPRTTGEPGTNDASETTARWTHR